ncbi:MAG: DEAD/DEAH box helicase [Bacteroidales bacterium]
MSRITIRAGDDLPYHFLYGTLPIYALVAIDRELSYRPAGYDRTDSYIKGDWDGRIQLFKQSRSGASWYFPSGLLSRVTNVLDIFGTPYAVVAPEPWEADPQGFEWVSPYTLRHYQQEIVDVAYAAGGGVVALPTGSGKTLVGLKLIQMFDMPTLVTVHTKELLYQWQTEIKKHLGVDCGVVGDGTKEWGVITVAMLQTLGVMFRQNEVSRLEFGMYLADEVHRTGADMTYNIAMRCTARTRFGLSATPKRTDNAELKIFAATGPIVSTLTPCDLIKAGYLARPKLTLISVGGAQGFFSQDWQKEYVAHIVTNDERNEKIVDEVVRLVREGKQVYIHVERIAHLDLLYNMIVKEIGADKVAKIWGKVSTDDRQRLLQRFRNCRLNVLIGTILKEGVDLPAMDAVILAGGLSSEVALVQKVGRVLRLNERFDYAEVIDFIDNGGRFCRKHSELRYQAFMDYYGDCIEIEMI